MVRVAEVGVDQPGIRLDATAAVHLVKLAGRDGHRPGLVKPELVDVQRHGRGDFPDSSHHSSEGQSIVVSLGNVSGRLLSVSGSCLPVY